MLMVERRGSAREVAPEGRWLRLVGSVIYLCFVSGRYGRK
nr:MAG TPA: motif TRP-interacting helix [Caudoviricetes sp.]